MGLNGWANSKNIYQGTQPENSQRKEPEQKFCDVTEVQILKPSDTKKAEQSKNERRCFIFHFLSLKGADYSPPRG